MAVIASMIFVAAASRLAPHPPNLTAITAIAFFGGAYFSDKWMAFGVPLSALLLTDAMLGFYPHMEIVYGSFAIIVAIGLLLRARRTAPMIAATVVTSSVVFFVPTNLGVWACAELYPRTITGLIACFTAALPFFRNMLVGDAIYCMALFGGLAVLEQLIPRLREPQAAASWA
jgi:hypothetical protein